MRIKHYDLHDAVAAFSTQDVWYVISNNDYSTLDWKSDKVEKPTLEQLNAKVTELNNAAPLEALRVERNLRLAATDWWASSDRTMTDEQTAYRKALRDLPANTSDPANPTWPTKPS